MATIELALLSEHLDDSQITTMLSSIAEETTETFELGDEDDGRIVDSSIDDDVFTDFRDRLDANDLNADIYLPMDFEEVIEVGEFRIGSTHALLSVLDSLREEFFVEADDGDEDEDDIDVGVDMHDDSGEDHDIEGEEPADDIVDYDRENEGDGVYGDGEQGSIEMKDDQLRHVWQLMKSATKESLHARLALILHD